MVRHQVQLEDPPFFEIIADKVQNGFRDAPVTVGLFDEKGAQIRRQVLSVMDVVLYDACPGNDVPFFIQYDIPLRYFRFAADAICYALTIGFDGDSPFVAKPAGGFSKREGCSLKEVTCLYSITLFSVTCISLSGSFPLSGVFQVVQRRASARGKK